MFKSRLYLRVFTNFALLLIVMTVLGLLTVYVISQIEKSNELALYNLRYLNQIRELDQLFSDVELASKNYFVTKTDLSKSKYLQTCQTIDTKFQSLNNSLTDSTVLFTLSIVKEKFYSWVSRIGDKKIELAQMDNTSKEYSTTFQNILTEEADAQYLELTK